MVNKLSINYDRVHCVGLSDLVASSKITCYMICFCSSDRQAKGFLYKTTIERLLTGQIDTN